ncbi:hypothetical protein C0995_014936 [Termitomyces sp. Mi166|nr:hypothetical protein C0995_014936 [Termitomyces sp. Mi166\
MGETAKHPFENPDADIILRSSDQPLPTDFRVFKFLLSLASPFFATAFTLPQPPTDGSEDVPVMEMEEDAKTLGMILGFCYPISVHRLPRLTTLKDVRAILQAAEKFEMKGVQEYVRETVVDGFLADKPVSVFAIACHYGWKEVVVQAAYRFLALPIDSVPPDEPELELITAATYRRLLGYRKECGEAAKKEVIRLAEAGATSTAPWGAKPTTGHVCIKKAGCDGVGNWWAVWMLKSAEAFMEIPGRSRIDLEASTEQMAVTGNHPFENPDADIILRSSDQPLPTDFRVFKFLLSLASPFFAKAFTLPQPPTDVSEDVPVMEMQENAKTLRMILGFCYPISVHRLPRLTTLEDVRAILKAAEKYEMKGVQEHVRETLVNQFLEDKPVSVFAIACHYGWKEVVDQAAYRFLALPINSVPADESELELITAVTYCRLFQYRKDCGEVAKREVIWVEAKRLEEVVGATSTSPWGTKPLAATGYPHNPVERPRKVAVRENIYTLPNALTLSRILACPVLGWSILDGNFHLATALLVYAGLTDLADGFLARRFKMQSVLGTILDPAADKTLMTTLTVTLAMQDQLPIPLAVIILGRDILLSLSAFYIRYTSLPEPINTALQLALMGITTVHPLLPFELGLSLTGLQWTVATTTIWSGLSYVFSKDAVRLVSGRPPKPPSI